jgi:phosphoserine phosphatase
MKLALLSPQLSAPLAHATFEKTGLSLAPAVKHREGLYSAALLTEKEANRETLASACHQAGCDWALLPEDIRTDNFKLLAMDMDSTLISIECIDEIADFVGKKKEVSAITEAAMRGEITDFSDSLRRRVALLAGVEASNLEAVFNERLRLNPGAESLLAFAKHHGWKTLLVSGGFTYFTDRLKAQLNLDYSRSNTLEIVDGKLTGRVLGSIVDAQLKAETVAKVTEEMGIGAQQAIVMGDGANDLKMMAIAGISVAYRAKPVVQAQARFAINFNGLEALPAWFEVGA